MADNDEREEITPRGNEWEVVSLTASAYAAAPGPEQVELSNDSAKMISEENKAETSRALFMSGHFVFPPNQHENLPLEPESSEIDHEMEGDLDAIDAPELITDENPGENMKGLTTGEFPEIPCFDDKGNILPASDANFENTVVFTKGKKIQSDEDFCSVHSGTKVDKSGSFEPDDQSSDSGFSQSQDLDNDDFPGEVWWKKKAISFYSLTKETNTFWSIVVAAAVMGLVVLGHRWQQERWQVLHHKHFGPGNERMSRILCPITRLKDVVLGGQLRCSLIRGAASDER